MEKVEPKEHTPPAVGADVPWTTYLAKDAQVQGAVLTNPKVGEIAFESLTGECVKLSLEGEELSWEAEGPANALVLRYALPDAPKGGGIEATLSLYVNGKFRQKLLLTSKYAWLYDDKQNGQKQDPSLGGAHRFFDESNAWIEGAPIKAGDRVTLRKDVDDTADWYIIDLLDLEDVPAPLKQTLDTLSIVDYGAIPNDGLDDTEAFKACAAAARKAGKGVWIPKGKFGQTEQWDISNLKVFGSGPWYTRIVALNAPDPDAGFSGNCGFYISGKNVEVHDLSIYGTTVDRSRPNQHGFRGSAEGLVVDNVWVEHTKTGVWIGSTHGAVFSRCRFRNTMADGFNINNDSSNVRVEQCHTRNTGDDGLAVFSNTDHAGEQGFCRDIVFFNNTCDSPSWAHGIGIYGGENIRVESNLIRGAYTHPGIVVGSTHKAWPGKAIDILNNDVIDCGGRSWNQNFGGFLIICPGTNIDELRIVGNSIIRSRYDGFLIQGGDPEHAGDIDVLMADNTVIESKDNPVMIRSNTKGRIVFENNQFPQNGDMPAIVNKASPEQLTVIIKRSTEIE